MALRESCGQPEAPRGVAGRVRRERHHGDSRGGGDARTMHAVRGRAPAPHVVVIHARQIVVHE